MFLPDICGQKFGQLTVIEKSHSKHGNVYYLCECDCGKMTTVRSSYIRNGITKSCGCKRHHPSNSSYGISKVNKSYFTRIKKRARVKGLDFNLTIEYIQQLFDKQNGCCSLSQEPISFSPTSLSPNQTACLDRIDSTKGYIKGNVQWLHKDVNHMKWQLPTGRFLELCQKITHHNE